MRTKKLHRTKPFLKWVGGKGQLLEQFDNFYPKELFSGKITNYVEPFVGGGAVFFEIMQRFQPKSAYISDINPDLILLYRTIRDRTDELLKLLFDYQKRFDASDNDERKALFLETRTYFNDKRAEINYSGKIGSEEIRRSAQFIFLNKTCFNGLFRLNLKGGFNVPFGKYKTAKIADEVNVRSAANLLQNVAIQQANYDACFDFIDENTFIYFDPPYRPISQTSAFTAYAAYTFTDDHQIEIAEFLTKIREQTDAKFMLSNSDPKNENPDDEFFDDLYRDFEIHRVSAGRSINSNGKKRGKISEIIVTNY